MDQSLSETPVKGKKQWHKKYDIKYIHPSSLKRHKLREFFGNPNMFLFALDQKKPDL